MEQSPVECSVMEFPAVPWLMDSMMSISPLLGQFDASVSQRAGQAPQA